MGEPSFRAAATSSAPEFDALPLRSGRRTLTTADGIAAWWSDSVEGDPGQHGGQLRVRFPDVPEPFEFVVAHDDSGIRWETGAFPPWWKDTTIRWELDSETDSGGTLLRFSHTGFDPDDDVVPVITPAWASIIARLKRYAETGAADPFAVNG